MSPAVGRDGHRLTHSTTAPNGAPPSGGRDSFLNYFFGKENGNTQQLPGQSAAGAMLSGSGSRHVSQNLEPSIGASFRRGDTTIARGMSDPPAPVFEEQGDMMLDTAFVSYEFLKAKHCDQGNILNISIAA